jgi:hypothetical protein
MDTIHHISCPNCDFQFDVEDALAVKIQKELESNMAKERKSLLDKINEDKKRLEVEQQLFEEKKKNENALFKKKLDEAMAMRQAELRKGIEADFENQIKSKNEELQHQRKQILVLKDKELQIEKMKTQLQEQEKEIELKFEKQMRQQLYEKEEIIRKRLDEQIELKLKEKDKQLEDQKKLIEEMKRKSEQGSMQLQGEVQELAIEEYLKSEFPLDTIDEIKKGARGGDCIQIVNTRAQFGCGKIYYESKRTKEFQPSWIEKFKTDIRHAGADVGVLVTEVLPKGMERMGIMNGLWICTYEEFKGLSHVLRDSIVKISAAHGIQTNKGEKMEMLYAYLTSNEFRLQVEAIVEGFTQMQLDLNREKLAMQKMWTQREKQIEKVLINTTGMYGSIKGIAGNALPNIASLELPEGEE